MPRKLVAANAAVAVVAAAKRLCVFSVFRFTIEMIHVWFLFRYLYLLHLFVRDAWEVWWGATPLLAWGLLLACPALTLLGS